MAYIAPNSTIKFLRGVPLDSTYEHSIYFADASAQNVYFNTLVASDSHNNPLIVTAQSYQRLQRGIRVAIPADELYTCNYIMFQNTSFGYKWFYAFIDSVEYINNTVSEVMFTLDVLQTWYFDYTLERCFVERQHFPTDYIGENIEPEPVDVGEYVFNSDTGFDYHPLVNMAEFSFVVMVADTSVEASGMIYDGVYSGCVLYAFTSSEIADLNALLDEYLDKGAPDAVVSMYVVPSALLTGKVSEEHIINTASSGYVFQYIGQALSNSTPIDGYVPKNRKLYTYPYNFYHVDNSSGESLSLRYEFFANHQPTIKIEGTITQPVALTAKPYNYKNVNGSGLASPTLNTEVIKLAGFPMCSWVTDSYAAWVAQNSLPIAAQVIGTSVVSGVTGFNQPIPKSAGGGVAGIGGAVAGVAGNLFGSAINVLTQMYAASIRADVMRGSVNNGGVNCAHGTQQFYGGRCSITAQKARVLDDYFERFGYAINRIMTPSRLARPHWTYVKTLGCTIVGSIPNDDMNAICKIFDNGITWWKYGSEVGQYNLDNHTGL